MMTRILDYIDFEKVNALLEGFNQSTGFVTAILDLEGNVLSKSGWRQVCTEFHRINPETSKKCTISDTVLAGKLTEGEKYHFYKCLNGLVDVAVPVVIKGEHIANLFSGQFFFENPDISFFKNQAKKYGFDEDVYLGALRKVPIVSEDKVKTAMGFLLNMTYLISDMTFQKIEQIASNEVLSASKEKYKLLFDRMLNGFALHEIICNSVGEPIDYRFIEVNSAFGIMTGLIPSDLIGKTCLEVMPNTEQFWIDKYGDVALTGKQIRFEHFSTALEKNFEVMAYSPQPGQFATIFNDITERKIAEEELLKTNQQLEMLSEHLETAREEERAFMAREIHDELGQSLTAMHIDMEMALESVGNEKLLIQKLTKLLEINSVVIKDVQRISSQLRPSILDDLGLVPAIEWYCNTFQNRTGLNCKVKLEDVQLENSKNDIAVFRVVQESLTNIARHAKASNVNVELKKNGAELIVHIKDDGIGFSLDLINSSQSLGLIGMRERMNHINGRIEFKSELLKGTTVSIFVPVEERKKAL